MPKVHKTLHDQARRDFILNTYKRLTETLSGKLDFPPALPPTVIFNEISISHYAFLPKANNVKMWLGAGKCQFLLCCANVAFMSGSLP